MYIHNICTVLQIYTHLSYSPDYTTYNYLNTTFRTKYTADFNFLLYLIWFCYLSVNTTPFESPLILTSSINYCKGKLHSEYRVIYMSMSVDNVVRVCIQCFKCMCPRLYMSVSKVVHVCVQGRTCLCPRLYMSVSKALQVCIKGFSSLCPRSYMSVSNVVHVCVLGRTYLCPRSYMSVSKVVHVCVLGRTYLCPRLYMSVS